MQEWWRCATSAGSGLKVEAVEPFQRWPSDWSWAKKPYANPSQIPPSIKQQRPGWAVGGGLQFLLDCP